MSTFLKKVFTPSGTPAQTPTSSRPSTPGSPRAFVRKLPNEKALDILKQADVPYLTLAECEGCDAGDDEDACKGYPKGFSVELDDDLLGTIKGYSRMAIIGTGKEDWEHDVTESRKTLAGALSRAYDRAEPVAVASSSRPEYGMHDIFSGPASTGATAAKTKLPKLTTLNSSHIAPSDDDESQSILVFPDWKVVTNTDPDLSELTVSTHLSPSLPPTTFPWSTASPDSPFRSRPLPYRAVILLCSHRRRDKRCHIAAPLLADALASAMHAHGIHVDDRGEALGVDGGEAAEEWTGGEEEKAGRWRREVEAASRGEGQEGAKGSVGVFRVSHIGGHKYSGNVICQFPNGASIWYGRVAPSDCAAIVEKTILGGQIIVNLLRGGIGISNAAKKPCGVLSW